jgi:hypothetical protein
MAEGRKPDGEGWTVAERERGRPRTERVQVFQQREAEAEPRPTHVLDLPIEHDYTTAPEAYDRAVRLHFTGQRADVIHHSENASGQPRQLAATADSVAETADATVELVAEFVEGLAARDPVYRGFEAGEVAAEIRNAFNKGATPS